MTVDSRPRSTPGTGRQIVDPRNAYPRPPFPFQKQELPGRDARLEPRPDHGETSYVGHGLLAGLATIVTGADSGIGKAVALAFAREGADVVISYLDAHDDARQTIDLVEAEGRRAVVVAGDLQDERHCRRIVEQTRDELGRVDVLVNNAAYQQRFEAVEEVSTDEWERTLRTNATATFWMCREAVKGMEPGASIINVSSIQAREPSANLLAYATTKGALVTYSQALARMLASRGIRVNVVAPGPVWTPLVAATTDPEHLSTFGGDTPLGRPAQPVELAPAFVFLASPAASYITGAVIPVTGGELFG
ncbi:MAG TPA: glucose 1-dehydrogenase [Verrucomicrobiae bacterium]|jgi:NAD(P)-dependent dehydrogenase (short-subunit alcohol dehydrogenase family)|nr:glucose 1-dehydrogenase [Verrucomicrobiae bacterium]